MKARNKLFQQFMVISTLCSLTGTDTVSHSLLTSECLSFQRVDGMKGIDQPISRADPGFFLGGGALVSCSTSKPINHIVFFFLQNASCIRKPQVISRGGGGAHPLHPPSRSAPRLDYK